MNRLGFFKESIKNLRTIGTITRSSKYLCKGMIRHVDFKKARVLVELGAGDGVITKYILKNMHKDCILLTFEVNEKFCNRLRLIKDKRLVVIEDSAEKIGEYLKKHGASEIDYIVSAIPFVTLPDELGTSIISNCQQYLRKGGLFIQVHYSLLAKKMYQKIFGNVDISFVPLNIPPAFVLVSENRA